MQLLNSALLHHRDASFLGRPVDQDVLLHGALFRFELIQQWNGLVVWADRN